MAVPCACCLSSAAFFLKVCASFGMLKERKCICCACLKISLKVSAALVTPFTLTVMLSETRDEGSVLFL